MENAGQYPSRSLSAGPNRASWRSQQKTKPAMASEGKHQERRGDRPHSPMDRMAIGPFVEKKSLYLVDIFSFL
jgi:hypothetical protein